MKTLATAPRCVVWSIFVLLGGGVGGGSTLWLMQRPAVTVIDLKEVDGLATHDGALDISLTLVRNRTCDGHVDRWMWEYTGMVDRNKVAIKRWVPLPYTTNPPTALDVEVTYVLSLPLPGNIKEGDWFYWSRTSDNCGGIVGINSPPRESGNVPVHVSFDSAAARRPIAPELLSINPPASPL